MLQVSTGSLFSAQCAADVDLTYRKWRTDETCELIFFVLAVSASPKNSSFFSSLDILDARNVKPAAAIRMPTYYSSLSLKRHVMDSHDCSRPLNVNRTEH